MLRSIKQLISQADEAQRTGRLEEARRDLSRAVALARRLSQTPPLIVALKRLAHRERELGNLDTALVLLEEALALGIEESRLTLYDPALNAHTARHLGDLHRQAERLCEAAPYYLEAITTYRSLAPEHTTDLADTLHSLALLHEAQGHYESARVLCEEAHDLSAAFGSRPDVDDPLKEEG